MLEGGDDVVLAAHARPTGARGCRGGVFGIDCGAHEIAAVARPHTRQSRRNLHGLARYAADDGAAGALAGVKPLGETPRCVTLVYCDIAGTAAEAYVLRSCSGCRPTRRPRATVVKNLRLRKLAISFAGGEAGLAPRAPRARGARAARPRARARASAPRRRRAADKLAAAISFLGLASSHSSSSIVLPKRRAKARKRQAQPPSALTPYERQPAR